MASGRHPIERALVTGATGFLGSALVARLRSEAMEVVGVSRHPPVGDDRFRSLDVRCLTDLEEAMKTVRPSHVFHVAGDRPAQVRSPADLRSSLDLNVAGSGNVVLAAAAVGARVVVVGSAEEYGSAPAPYREDVPEQPSSVYGLSKATATRAVLAAAAMVDCGVTVVRATVGYGPGQPPDMFIAALLRSLLSGQPFGMTSGDQVRDFVYVDDVVEGLVRVAKTREAEGRILNLGLGQSTVVRDAAALAERVVGVTGLIRAGVLPPRPGEPRHYVVDMATTESLLSWRPRVTLAEGLKLTVEWMR